MILNSCANQISQDLRIFEKYLNNLEKIKDSRIYITTPLNTYSVTNNIDFFIEQAERECFTPQQLFESWVIIMYTRVDSGMRRKIEYNQDANKEDCFKSLDIRLTRFFVSSLYQ